MAVLAIRKALKLFTAILSIGPAVLGLLYLRVLGVAVPSSWTCVRRVCRRHTYRKFILLELNYLPTFKSEPRGRGFGLVFFDNEKPAFTTMQLWAEGGLSVRDKLYLCGLFTLSWLGYFSEVIAQLKARQEGDRYVNALCALYLADFCLFARSWEKEFEQDHLLHNCQNPFEMFGRWVEELGTDLGTCEKAYLTQAERHPRASLKVAYFKLLRSFVDSDLIGVGRSLERVDELRGPKLPFTKKAFESASGKVQKLGPFHFQKFRRRKASDLPNSFEILPATSCEVSFFEVKNGEVKQKSKKFTFPTFSCAKISSGFISGMFANDVVTAEGDIPCGSLLFNDPDDPRIRIFSPARAFVEPDSELLAIKDRIYSVSQAILLPGLADNFFHFLFETLGSLLLLPPELRNDNTVVFGGVSGRIKPFQQFLLKGTGIKDFRYFFASSGEWEFAEGVWCQNPSWHTLPRPEVVRKVIEHLAPDIDEKDHAPYRRVFFKRSGQRRLDPKIWQRLNAICQSRQIEVCDPAQMSIDEQIRLMSQTKILISESGAAASNAMYMAKGSVMIVLVTHLAVKECFATIAKVRGIHLIYVFSDVIDFFQNPIHTWTEPVPALDFVSLERAWELAEELIRG